MVVSFENNFNKTPKQTAEDVIELSPDDLIMEDEPSAAKVEDDSSYSLDALIDKSRSLRNFTPAVEPKISPVEKPKIKPAAEYIESLEEGDYEIVENLPDADPKLVNKYDQHLKNGGVQYEDKHELSAIGEKMETWGPSAELSAMSHVYSLYDQKERPNMDKCEDTVAFNRNANMIALGDGMGGVGKGDFAAKAFKKGMEDIDLGDFSGKSDDEIKNIVFEKFKQVADGVKESGGQITCSALKFFKAEDGKNKAVVVNVADSAIVRLGKNGKFEVLGEPASQWDVMMKQDNINIVDNPESFAVYLRMNSFGKYPVPDLDKYLQKLVTAIPQSEAWRTKFDFHAVMNFVSNDPDISDEIRKNIIGLFKNVNRKTPGHFGDDIDDARSRVLGFHLDHIKIVDVAEGDQFMLGSDGLFDNLDNDQIEAVMESCDFSTPEGQAQAAEYIKNNVNKKIYVKPDDVSYAAVKFKG